MRTFARWFQNPGGEIDRKSFHSDSVLDTPYTEYSLSLSSRGGVSGSCGWPGLSFRLGDTGASLDQTLARIKGRRNIVSSETLRRYDAILSFWAERGNPLSPTILGWAVLSQPY